MKALELIKLAKQIDPTNICGIYAIINLITNKAYIGQSISIYRRWTYHKSKLKLKTHSNTHLQNSYNKYGLKCFQFVVLETCELDYDLLSRRENDWLMQLDELDRYNLSSIIKNGPMSEETRKKIGENSKSRGPLKKETKKKISEILKTRIFTDEHRARISAAKKGKSTGKQSDETKRKRSEALKGRKRPPRTADWCRKLSESKKRSREANFRN